MTPSKRSEMINGTGLEWSSIKNNSSQLVVETQTGAFSKGGLDTKYVIGGDFDIQLECQINFDNFQINAAQSIQEEDI